MKSCQILRSISEEELQENMGDEVVKIENNVDNNKAVKAKEFGRQASKCVVGTSKTVAKKSSKYTKSTINIIAQALPNSEITILAVMLVTIFIRAEEAHLKEFCNNDGSVGWIVTAIGCCIVAFAKYHDTRCTPSSLASCLIYFLIQVSINYPPFGCLFGGLVVGADGSGNAYSSKTRSFAIIQVLVLVLFSVVYTVVIYKKRIGAEEEKEKESS